MVTITITSPSVGQTLTGTVTVDATYTGTGFDLATLTVDGAQKGTADTSEPISFQLDTRTVPDGTHQIGVSVRYRTGKQKRWAKSVPVTVTVHNTVVPPPSTLMWGARIDSDVYGTGGDAPWDLNTWDTFETHAGAKVDVLHFGQPSPWKQAFAHTPFDNCRARNALPLCSMSTDTDSLLQIASGWQDTAIKTWAAAAANWGGRILLRLNWEMNGHWYAWANQPAADYISCWQHFRSLLPANVETVWCPNILYPGAYPLTDRWPGNSYVDWVGMDGYNWGTNPLKGGGWHTFDQVFRPTYDALTALTTKPLIICETASTEYGGSKADWITGMWQTLPSMSQVQALTWFNWNVIQGAGRMDWPIESSPTAQTAFAAGAAAL